MTPQKFGKLISTLIVAMLVISACGGADASPTPTEPSLDAVYTAAAATVFAGQTGTAGAQPSKTLTPTGTVTPTGTITTTPTPTRAVYVPAQPVYVAVSTTTGTPGTLVPTAIGTYGAVGGKNSALVQDGAVASMRAGETFTKTWVIKNTGTVTWSSTYKIVFIGGNAMGRDNSTKIFKTVAPGETYTQNLGFTTPSSPGTYTGNWRLADDSGNLFGAGFSVVVTVPGATYTPTSSVSATPNANATATAVAAAATAAANANANANATAVAAGVAATQTAAANANANATAIAAGVAATQTAAAAQTAAYPNP